MQISGSVLVQGDTLLITISLFDIYDLLIPSQHNHKCLPESKENIVLKGWSI